MKKELTPTHEMVACDVCGRTILKGERTEPYLVPDGTRRLVCDLCTRRAESAGWLRESRHGDMPAAFPRAEPRGSLLSRLRKRFAENGPVGGVRGGGKAEPAHEPEAWRAEESAYRYEDPAGAGEGGAYGDEAPYPEGDLSQEEPYRREEAGLEDEETAARPSRSLRHRRQRALEPREEELPAPQVDERAEPPAVDEPELVAEPELGDPEPDTAARAYVEAEPEPEPPPEPERFEAAEPVERPVDEDPRLVEEPPPETLSERIARRSRRRVRDPRHVRAIPTGPEAKVEQALELFNLSEHRRTVGGLVRTLGEPWVTALPQEGSTSEVTLVVAWELSWYQYRVDLSDADQAVELADKGHEIHEIDQALQRWNASATADGALVPEPPDVPE